MLTCDDDYPSMHDWAMFYQSKGVAIFPLRPMTKIPFGGSTKKKKQPLGDFAGRIRRASKDGIVPTPEDVDGFWSTPGGMYANIGFFPSWVVIDVDAKPNKTNGADTLRELLSEDGYQFILSQALIVNTPTGTGRHLHFSPPELDQAIRHGKWNEHGLECFSRGHQYLLLPPSMVEGVGDYTFLLRPGEEFSTTVLKPVPDSLMNLINGLGKGNSIMRSGTAHIPQTTVEGLPPLNPTPQHFSSPKWTEEMVEKNKKALERRLQLQHGAVNTAFKDIADKVSEVAEQAPSAFMEEAIKAGGELAKKRKKNLKKKRDFFLLKDGRWVIKFDGEYYPISLEGPPYEGKPEEVTEQELIDCGFYEPRDNDSKAMFIERDTLEVLVFVVPKDKKTGERLNSKGKWFFINLGQRIPFNQIV